MHLHWERSINTAGDCVIRSLSWMGRVPDEIPQEEGWKLSRNHYYQEGWLSTANLKGVVGVTYTSSLCGDGEAQLSPPSRTNYNLRGHRAEVTLVRWNEPYQKLASCDTSGIIFVWIKYEGRWSIELINDRNTPVICFSWSHDGRMALICYQDGFVLVGSVAGQRYWSTLLPADVNNITSGTWTPDDQHVYLGTSQGDILVMDIEGNTVGRVTLKQGVTISDLSWNCERFNMEEQPDQSTAPPTSTSSKPPQQCCRPDGKPYILAAALRNGDILLLRNYDDVIPQLIKTGFQNYCMDWTNNGNILAVAGKSQEMACRSDHSIRYINVVHFYNENGNLILKSKIPCETSPVTAITWGHNDKRLFIATGNQIHIAWVSSQVASLQLLSRLKVHGVLTSQKNIEELPLPCRMQNLIGMLFTQTIRCCIPNPSDLRDFVLKPQPDGVRLHCTMIRHNDSSHNDSSNNNSLNNQVTSGGDGLNNQNSAYTLYLEHLGGFLPLLKGKKVSKIRPEFVIYDPQMSEDSSVNWLHYPNGSHLRRLNLSPASNSETETDDDINSPRVRRRRRRRRGPLPRYGYIGNDTTDYMNILPEENRLAEVSSNIWGTKFKIIGLNQDCLPPSLGQINYKASLLHLQPRQMRVEIVDLRDDAANFVGDWGGDDYLDDDWQSEDFESLDYPPNGPGYASDEDEERDTSGVTMKDDILTAVTTDVNVATVAPLPSRLSFCIGPRPQEQTVLTSEMKAGNVELRMKTAYDNEIYISNAIIHEIKRINENDRGCLMTDEVDQSSPTKLARIATGLETPTHLAMALATKRSPTIVPSRKAVKGDATLLEASYTTFSESPTCHKVKVPESLVQFAESPSKQRRLRVSVSCDNYLSEAKFALSRRDSVGSGSPHSSKGSPLRWATKADELASMMTTSMIAPPNKDLARAYNESELSACQRSCSANQLDLIVDILGVPSEVLSQRDVNKRLILLGEKTNPRLRNPGWQNPRRNTTKKYRRHQKEKLGQKIPSLDQCGKSKSCDDAEQETPRKSRKELEAKRRSIYGRECKGRNETKPCTKCMAVANQINDIELNREIFDIPTPPPFIPSSSKPSIDLSTEEIIQVVQDRDEIVREEISTTEEIPDILITNDPEEKIQSQSSVIVEDNPKVTKSPRTRRRFDSVRNLLEKARQKLMTSRPFWNHKNQDSKGSSEPKDDTTKPDNQHLRVPNSIDLENSVTQSNPSTPAQLRKNNCRRNRSFSPVGSFWNSPLLRRRKKMSIESSDEDINNLGQESVPRRPKVPAQEVDVVSDGGSNSEVTSQNPNLGYHNLETFQRKKLKQKLKKLTQPSGPSLATPSKLEDDDGITLTPSIPLPSSSCQPESSSPLRKPPYPSPPPAPQRVPHPPGKTRACISHSTTKGGFSPFLGRKSKLFGGLPATPNSTPFSTPFVKRRHFGASNEDQNSRLNSFLPQHNQVYSLDNDPVNVCTQRTRRRRRRLVLHNKAPMWNDASQVYQLDFGGRVTQESAKNFQIEYKGKQVMQFGRIDNNAYTLDFQYPFTAVQAFAVALANVTQRLK